jgi:hypothetical protein
MVPGNFFAVLKLIQPSFFITFILQYPMDSRFVDPHRLAVRRLLVDIDQIVSIITALFSARGFPRTEHSVPVENRHALTEGGAPWQCADDVHATER